MTHRQDRDSRAGDTDAVVQRMNTFAVQLRRAVGSVRSIVATYVDLACDQLRDAVTHLESTISALPDEEDEEDVASTLCAADR